MAGTWRGSCRSTAHSSPASFGLTPFLHLSVLRIRKTIAADKEADELTTARA